MSVTTDDSSGTNNPEGYKNISEKELHEYAEKILKLMNMTGTPEHKKLTQVLIPHPYIAIRLLLKMIC